jgi:hypothetical protein
MPATSGLRRREAASRRPSSGQYCCGIFAEGTVIATVYRLIDALPPAVPTVDLRTPCFTFTIK